MNANESLPRVGPILRARRLEKNYGEGDGLVRAEREVLALVARGLSNGEIPSGWSSPRRRSRATSAASY